MAVEQAQEHVVSPRKRTARRKEADPDCLEQAVKMRRDFQREGLQGNPDLGPESPFTVSKSKGGDEPLVPGTDGFPSWVTAKQTKSFAEAASFYDDFLDEVLTRDPDDRNGNLFDAATCTLGDLAEWLDQATHSSSFTGVAAPETALLGLHRAVQARMPETKARFGKNARGKKVI